MLAQCHHLYMYICVMIICNVRFSCTVGNPLQPKCMILADIGWYCYGGEQGFAL